MRVDFILDFVISNNLNTEFFSLVGMDTRSFFYVMLEAGMSLIAVNLPSLRLFTSIMLDKLVRSIRSVISLALLSSGRRSGLDSTSAAAANESTTHLGRKPESASSMNSGRPDFPSDLS